MNDLKGKNIIVTGASGGIGNSIIEKLNQSGANILASGTRIEKLEELKEKYGNIKILKFDISQSDKIENFIENASNELGGLDCIVNNAGITKDGLIMRMTESDWNTVIDINLKGVFNGVKSVSRQMMKQKYGRIINISSIVGLIGNPGQANYAASKSGVIGLGKAVSKELAPRNITVNTIAPGYIDTEMVEKIDEKAKHKLLNQIPLGRIGSPEDIAATVVYLASDEAGYVSGQTIAVDGGMTTT